MGVQVFNKPAKTEEQFGFPETEEKKKPRQTAWEISTSSWNHSTAPLAQTGAKQP